MTNGSFQSPAKLRLTETGREWLNAYDDKRRHLPQTFYARDVWAEVLRALAKGPDFSESIVKSFRLRQDFLHYPATELRRQITTLRDYGYIESDEAVEH